VAAETGCAEAADALYDTTKRLRAALDGVPADPRGRAVVAGARGLALRMAYALATALLVEHAAWGDEGAAAAAPLWARRWLAGDDIAADADAHLDALP
jgi:hypothetical protein